MEAQKLLESAGPFMQAPVQEVRAELRRLRNSLQPDKIPHDVANRWKQIRDLLYREPEFEIRYPAAYGLLMEPRYPEIMDELGGLSLPSFGVRIFRHDPYEQVKHSREPGEHYDAFTTRHSGGEAKGPLLKHEFEPLDLGYLQGILFEVLGRDEYWERLHKRYRDPDLILRYGAPDKSLIRLTDLRLARKLVAELKSEKFKDGTKRILDSLERPPTPDGVAKWKRQILDPASGFVEQRFGNPFDYSAPAGWLEDRQLGVMVPSFSAAALLLFLDLDMPGIASKELSLVLQSAHSSLSVETASPFRSSAAIGALPFPLTTRL